MKKNIIFALIGSSRSGKTMLMTEAVNRIGENNLAIVKSFTTRYKRSEEDELIYDFITKREFNEKVDDGDVVQYAKYAGHIYGNSHEAVKRVLKDKHGILALVEEAVANFRNAGYVVKPIKVVPKHQKSANVSELRKNEDAKRSRLEIDFNLEIPNSFRRGGKEKAIAQLVDFIRKF